MPHPRPYSLFVSLTALPLVAWSVTQVRAEDWRPLLLFMLAYAVLCTRTYTLSAGTLMTAGSPLATTAMLLFNPLDLFAFVVPGMLVVKLRHQRPWGNTLINIVAVGGGLACGAWIYREILRGTGLTEAPFVYRIVPFLVAQQARDLVNHALIAPVIGRQRALPTWQILWETTVQSGMGHLALNATGLGFAYLVAREGPAVLLYIVLILLGMHAAIAFSVRRSEMQRASEQDGLTLTRNRRAFDRVAQRPGWRGTLVMVDCDGLKRLNDTMGHLAGDEMLKALALRLVQTAGEENVFRYGGDEFVVLLDDDSLVADIQQAIDEMQARFGTSASLGACRVPQEAEDIARAFPLADQRMYAAKEGRRTGRAAANT